MVSCMPLPRWHHSTHYPHYWSFVRRIPNHQEPVDSPHKGPVQSCVNVFFVVSMNMLFNKQWSCWWFEVPQLSVWCFLHNHLNVVRLNQDEYVECIWVTSIHNMNIISWCIYIIIYNVKCSPSLDAFSWMNIFLLCWVEAKWLPFCKQHFQMHFLNDSCSILIKNLL